VPFGGTGVWLCGGIVVEVGPVVVVGGTVVGGATVVDGLVDGTVDGSGSWRAINTAGGFESTGGGVVSGGADGAAAVVGVVVPGVGGCATGVTAGAVVGVVVPNGTLGVGWNGAVIELVPPSAMAINASATTSAAAPVSTETARLRRR